MLRPQKGNSEVLFNDTLSNKHNSEWQDTDQLKFSFYRLALLYDECKRALNNISSLYKHLF